MEPTSSQSVDREVYAFPEAVDIDLFNCGHLCMAARALGFKMMKVHRDGMFCFAWVDLMNNRSAWLCEDSHSEVQALVNACRQMQNYLRINP